MRAQSFSHVHSVVTSAVLVAAGILLARPALSAPVSTGLSATEIVRRSVAVNGSDWKAQPNFSHREEDVKSKEDSSGKVLSRQDKTYQVTMIDGSPYNRLVEINHEPLSPVQAKQEQAKMAREIATRGRESASQRHGRIAKYQQDRAEEKLLMQQMATAFDFSLQGEQVVNGVDCYILDASPDPSYQPPVQRARVLLGMKGRLYIDKTSYHWVRVEAQVISPVEFGLFLAKVKPGTRFELDQSPAGGTNGVWLPAHFVQSVNATVLGVYDMRNKEEEFYSDYQPIAPAHHLVASR